MIDKIILVLVVLAILLTISGLCFLLFAKRARIAREARTANAPREWLFVNAYGSQQARSGEPQTYGEALSFLKNHIGCSFVRSDRERGIIFFDGRKLGG